ncbi:MAG: hydantoinase/oxoprolinase family protein [Chloroflexi bacterium]|nr:hydantoinase/oxoprolinase family protein [Chloroflexota bacterium]
MAYIIGIDTGGTFTDIVVLSEDDGKVTTDKAPSTPRDFSIGVIDAVENAARQLGMSGFQLLNNTAIFAIGTTVATNMLLTHTGTKTGHITTKGFEDTLLIGRVNQKIAGLSGIDVLDLARLDKARPVIPRNLIKGVTERIDYKGEVIVPLVYQETAQVVRDLVEKEHVEAIAVVLLWSFMNPEHEQEIKKIINQMYPQIYVTISSELVPKIKEYERAATTSINAYVGKGTSRYISSLGTRLKENGLKLPPMIMQNMGGFTTADEACRKPVLTCNSGPAGGVVGAQALANLLGYKNIITTDMGGTSFDVGLVVNGVSQFASQLILDKYVTLNPTIDVTSIGAGSGSIAWIEPDTGLLKVGPQSAAADPGPVCYEKGGTEPTVTDANIVLGRYPGHLLGGKIKLNKEKSFSAIKTKIADPLKMDVATAAISIIDIVDSHMADLIRKVTVAKGYDPGDFVIFSFGGAGAAHVGSYGYVGSKTAIIPNFASEFSAFGICSSDVIHINELSEPMRYPFGTERITAIYQDLENKALKDFQAEGFSRENILLTRLVDLRYIGQIQEMATRVPAGDLNHQDMERVIDEFEAAYELKYGKGSAYKIAGIEATTYRVHGVGKIIKPSPKKRRRGPANSSAAIKEKRDVYFRECDGFRLINVYDRGKLQPGNIVEGPAIIEAVDTTVVVHPGQTVKLDGYSNMIMQLSQG